MARCHMEDNMEGVKCIWDEHQGTNCLLLVEEEESVYTGLPQSQYMYVTGRPNAFIANREKLCISPALVEMVSN